VQGFARHVPKHDFPDSHVLCGHGFLEFLQRLKLPGGSDLSESLQASSTDFWDNVLTEKCLELGL
jgi:hypothetical protein